MRDTTRAACRTLIVGALALALLAPGAVASPAPPGLPLASLAAATLAADDGPARQQRQATAENGVTPEIEALLLQQAGELTIEQLAEIDPEAETLMRDPSQDRPTLELSVLDAVETALRYNLQVQVSRFNQESSFEGIKAAKAPFDPQLSFQLPQSFQRSTSPTTDQTQGADILTSENFSGGFSFNEQLEWGTNWSVNWNGSRNVSNNQFSTVNPTIRSGLSFNVTQPLLRNFGSVNRTGILVARNTYTSSREAFRFQVQNQIQQVYNAYWNLVGAVRQLEVNQEALSLALQQLRRNRIQVDIGTLAPIETVQSEQQTESAKVSVITSQNTLENAQDTLKQLLNLQAVRDDWRRVFIVATDEPDATVDPVDLEEAIATALDNDPNLRQGRIGLESVRLQLDQARNQLLPSVNLNASLNLAGVSGDQIIRSGGFGGGVVDVVEGGFTDALSQVFSGDFNTWSVGLQVQLPLHNWSAEAAHARATISERQQVTSLEQQRQQVVFAVRQAVRNLQNGARQVQAARVARDLAERQLEAENRRFEVGTSTNFQVLQFQRTLNQQQLSELQAIVGLAQARAQLEVAKGTLLDFFGVSIQEAGRGR